MNIFKANDIRARYPEEWNKETAYKIGFSLADIFTGNRIVMGRDGRTSSREIVEFLVQGLIKRGINVFDIGMVDTPAVYFTVGKDGYDGGIMVTASHNPVGYNGVKLVGKNAAPFDYENGIKRLESLVHYASGTDIITSEIKEGSLYKLDIRDDYVNFILKYKKDYSEIKTIIDCSNGMAGIFIHDIVKNFQGETIVLNEEIDGTFPAHGPNPSLDGSLKELKKSVVQNHAAIGFCFDGDADRVVVVDEKGNHVSPDLITAVLGNYFLRATEKQDKEKNKILVDMRSSNSVSEYLKNRGGISVRCPVGHAKIKKMLRDEDAVFAGELTGHYYYRDNYYCDSAWITVLLLLNVILESGEKISSLSSRILNYAFSGERSFPLESVEEQDAVINAFLIKYSNALIDKRDGVRFDYHDWWFMIRKSGTEPLLRLVLEARDKNTLNEKLKTISTEILSFSKL